VRAHGTRTTKSRLPGPFQFLILRFVEERLLFWDWDARLLAVPPNQKFHEIRNTAMFPHGSHLDGVFDARVDTQI
jgi:hypothetical protein